MNMNIQLGDIGHIIQLAIAPVFMLSGVCTNLLVLLNRLARIIDRAATRGQPSATSIRPAATSTITSGKNTDA